jgi:hypothetical protein
MSEVNLNIKPNRETRRRWKRLNKHRSVFTKKFKTERARKWAFTLAFGEGIGYNSKVWNCSVPVKAAI